MTKFKHQKANITVSFSWLFMIIVGVLFIMLSYNVIAKYRANEELKHQVEIEHALRNIFNNFGRTTGTEKNKLEPLYNVFDKTQVEILCYDSMPILSINGNDDANNEYLKSYPTVMTYISKKDLPQVYMASENFKMPFKITNLLAIVSLKNLIVFDSSSQIGEELYNKFKKSSYTDLNYIYEDFSALNTDDFIENYVSEKSLDSIIFVTNKAKETDFNMNLDELKPFSYLILVEKITDKSGNIIYKDKAGKKDSFAYYDSDDSYAMVTMAVFSTPDIFNCSYNLLLKSIDSSYDFYIEKTKYYKNAPYSFCATHSQIESNYFYQILEDNLKQVQNTIRTDKFNKLDKLIINIDDLETQHMILESNDCSFVY